MNNSLKYIILILVLCSNITFLKSQSPQLDPSDFSAGFTITVDHTKVVGTTDFDDFPMLVDITNADLRNTVNGGFMENLNGYDILFTDDCNEVFPHEIESYDEANGRLIAWVRIPTLKATQATVLYLNYGNSSISDNTSSTSTWNSNYQLVNHLHDDFNDATSNSFDGTNTGSTDILGIIGDGQDFDGSGDYIEIPDDPALRLTTMTLSAWVYMPSIPSGYRTIVEHARSTNNWYGLWKGTSSDRFHYRWSTGTVRRTDFNTFNSNNTWYYVVGTLDAPANTAKCYLNGQLDKTVTGTSNPTPTAGVVRIGSNGSSSETFDGIIDEVRILNIPLTQDWIETEFNNQSSPNTFYSVVASTPIGDDIISGNLFEDLNADGIKDAGEVGHANATVQLLEDVNEDGLVDVGDVVISTVTTDANGDYTLIVPRKNATMEVLINDNDAEQETLTGNTFITSPDMDMGYLGAGSPYTCGFRYDNINVPPGAVITKAYLEFVAYSSLSGSVEVTIDGHDHDNAPVFADGTGTFNISSRTRTSEKVNWSPAGWTAETTYYSPDMSGIVQEIIDRGGWASGNAMAFIVEGGLNKREAYGWSTDPDKAAKLHVEYYLPPMSEFYLVNLDETSLPPNFAYTTVSEYDFNFTSCSSETSAGNDFGIQLIDICGNGLDDNNDGQIDEPYPGGVGENMLLWLKADAGFSPPTWTDQSPNENDGTTFGDPTQVANSMNFNPAINFDGDDYVEVNLPELVFDGGTHHVVIFAVYEPSTPSSAIGILGNQGTSNGSIELYNNMMGVGFGSLIMSSAYGDSPHLITYTIDEEDNVGGAAFSSPFYHNGDLKNSVTYNESNTAQVSSTFSIGKSGSWGGSLYFQGDIHEVIIYYEGNGNLSISDAQRQQIESYLGLKYGISLTHNYTDSQ